MSGITIEASAALAVKSLSIPRGVTLEYVEQGKTTGSPVIFLHGVTDSWRSFEPVLRHLPTSVRAIAVTARGHGGSSKPAEGYGYDDFSEDVCELLNALNVRAAVIAGHSMGSMVAQRFAALHPERTAGLVLMSSFRTLHRDPGIQEYWDSVLSTLTDPIDERVAREFQESTLARPIAPGLLDLFVAESLKVPARVWQAAFRGFLDTPVFDLTPVAAPALAIWGDRDGFSTRADQEALRAAIRGCQLDVWKGAGHALHWEEPERFASRLAEFVRSIDAAVHG